MLLNKLSHRQSHQTLTIIRFFRRVQLCWVVLVGLPVATACSKEHEPVDDTDLYACNVPADCVVVPKSCCGTCGAPTRGDAVAIASASSTAQREAACGANTACPACAPLFVDPTLVATCRAKRCELVDLLEHAASACTADSDCHVRTPDCCPCGGDTSVGRLIGVSSETAYSALVCASDQSCPECAPIYPKAVTVACNTDGHCETHDARLGPLADAGASDGGMLDAGRPDLCLLPPEAGPCDAYFQRYYFDPATGRCAMFVYGGCQGNDNNFETQAACESACHPASSSLAACEVQGVTYPSGSTGIADPVSCNTCGCEDGQLTSCTKIGCPMPCIGNTEYGTSCVRCGPVDNCEVVRTGCLTRCSAPGDCQSGESCVDSVCKNRCG